LIVLPFIKKRVYEVFLSTHIACSIAMIYAIWQHTRHEPGKLWAFPVAFVTTFALSATARILRVMFRNIVLGKDPVRMALSLHRGGVARLTLSLPRPWVVRAGERVNLGVPHVGIFYLFQSHPFTITWWENDTKGRATSISILCRPRSGFTRRLVERVEPNRECGAWIDGPFGPSSISITSSNSVTDFGHIFMVSTGIGIAAQIPYIKDILDGHHPGRARTRKLSMVWQVDQLGDWESARSWLQALVEQDNGYVSDKHTRIGN
jgi:predicted ferric reductase